MVSRVAKFFEFCSYVMLAVILFVLVTKYLEPNLIPNYSHEIVQAVSKDIDDFRHQRDIRNKLGDFKVIVKNKKAASIPVLIYHGIVEVPYKQHILLKDFEDQMIALKKAGYQTVTLEDFYDFMDGKKDLPDKSFLLTFDDGIKTSYSLSKDIFEALDYNAVMFIINKYSLAEQANYYLSINDLKEMLASGYWEVQVHCKNAHGTIPIDAAGNEGHYMSNKMWLAEKNRLETDEEFALRIHNEFVESKNDFENVLGIKAESYAFPFSDFGQSATNFPESSPIILNEAAANYKNFFYQVWPSKGYFFNYPESSNKSIIKRITAKYYWSGSDLVNYLNCRYEKKLPFRYNFSSPKEDWEIVVGEKIFQDNALMLSSTTSDAASLFLEGTYLWQDYVFKTKIDWLSGKTVSFLLRYNDSRNFVALTVSDYYIRLEQLVDGEKHILAQVKREYDFQKEDLAVVVSVKGDAIEASLDNKTILKAGGIDPSLSRGGVGYKLWDEEIGKCKILIQEVSIEKL